MVANAASRRVLVPLAIGGAPLPPFGSGVEIVRLEGPTMGTTWRVHLVGARAQVEAHRAAIVALLDELVATFSNWKPDSVLSRFNRAPIDAWQALPADLLDVLSTAGELHRASRGAFDPAVGAHVMRWGFGPRATPGPGRTTPPPDASGGTFDDIELDVAAGRARRRRAVVLDLCGIAKGHAVDRVSRLLVARGVGHHLVEIGGELRGEGVKPDGMPWWVDLESLDFSAALHGLSVATSGDHRHFFEHDGIRYAHTIDPRTGRPVARAPASVTVFHRDCMRADAEATAITVLGRVAGLAHADAHGLAALVVVRDVDGPRVHTSRALDAMLT